MHEAPSGLLMARATPLILCKEQLDSCMQGLMLRCCPRLWRCPQRLRLPNVHDWTTALEAESSMVELCSSRCRAPLLPSLLQLLAPHFPARSASLLCRCAGTAAEPLCLEPPVP